MSELSESFDVKKARRSLFKHLDDVLGLAEEKMRKITIQDVSKQKWARIRVAAVQAYGELLHTHVENEEIEERLSKLEGVKNSESNTISTSQT